MVKRNLAAQRARTEELDAIRLQRPLTVDEQRDADVLANRVYYRAWRQQRLDRDCARSLHPGTMGGAL